MVARRTDRKATSPQLFLQQSSLLEFKVLEIPCRLMTRSSTCSPKVLRSHNGFEMAAWAPGCAVQVIQWHQINGVVSAPQFLIGSLPACLALIPGVLINGPQENVKTRMRASNKGSHSVVT